MRGLKYAGTDVVDQATTSHSTRVRGLKSSGNIYVDTDTVVALYTSAWIEIEYCPTKSISVAKSHSTRVRGLKYQSFRYADLGSIVALYTSAWIEMLVLRVWYTRYGVALYTSAWIEITSGSEVERRAVESHSTRVRGLK